MTIQRTESETIGPDGLFTRVLIEQIKDAAGHLVETIVTRTEQLHDSGDGVSIVRRTVTTSRAGPYSTDAHLQLRVDLDDPRIPSPVEHAATKALLLPHIGALVERAAADGYDGDLDALSAFLEQTGGQGCIPMRPNAADRQTGRQEAVTAATPPDAVDAWIIANMGYTAESLAALAKSTRRDRRREARRQMTAAR